MFRWFQASSGPGPTSATFTVVDQDLDVCESKKGDDNEAWWEREEDEEF